MPGYKAGLNMADFEVDPVGVAGVDPDPLALRFLRPSAASGKELWRVLETAEAEAGKMLAKRLPISTAGKELAMAAPPG